MANRREFLKRSAAGVAGASSLGALGARAVDAVDASAPVDLPRHTALDLVGVHAYAEKSLFAGETIHFRVSASVPYKLSVCRLGGIDDRSSDEVLHTFPKSPAAPQPIHPGSYVHVANCPEIEESLGSFSIECWIRPARVDARQAIVGEFDAPQACGYLLALDERGSVGFYLGDGDDLVDDQFLWAGTVKRHQWHHLVAVWDGEQKSLWIDGVRVGGSEFAGPFSPGGSPLRLAAEGRDGRAAHFFSGDLAMPAIYTSALSAEAIKNRFRAKGLEPPREKSLWMCWPLTEESGEKVADSSGHGADGRIINHATWMIGGPSFDAASIARYAEYDPSKDAKRGHALRFAADDLYDCRWRVSHEYTIPATAKNGLYVGRFDIEQDGKPRRYYVTFLVKKPREQTKAPVLVLCASNTWLAYGSTSFAVNGAEPRHWAPDGIENSPGNPPAFSCYRNHADGQPTYQLGLNMPWPAAAPDVMYSPPGVGYSHLMRGERFTHAWLAEAGYDFDLVTDFDLDRDPDLLDGYRVLVINGHSEYWSIPAYQAVERFLDGGGNAVVLSGNTLFWRVSFNSDRSIMECRKFDPQIGGRENRRIGEIWHSQDKKRGSLMRECGYPAWKLVGLETVGWWGTDFDYFGGYELEQADHFLLRQPQAIDLKKGDIFALAQHRGMPGAVGHEADVRLSTLVAMTRRPLPRGGQLPEEPQGIVTLARGRRPKSNSFTFDYFTRPAPTADGTLCEMIYWQRPDGGRVFHAGAIGAGWALSGDARMRALLANVLDHFGVKAQKG